MLMARVAAAVACLAAAAALVLSVGGPVVARDGAFPAPGSTASRVSLAEMVDDHIASIPRRDEGYRVPTEAEAREMGEAAAALAAGKTARAARLAGRHDFDVVEFTDARTGAAHRALVERRRSDGTLPRGWGLYVLRLEGAARAHVQAPHPLFDVGTPRVALQQFDQTRAASLLIAGAHRHADADGNSDVAHAPVSAFESIHRSLTRAGDRVLQLHGFASANHPEEMGEVVVSDGTAAGSSAVNAVAESATTAGFAVCRYDGTRCKGLGATSNVQGASTRAAGADFVHIEISREVRDDPVRLVALVKAIDAAIR